jgi:hypothetical protein
MDTTTKTMATVLLSGVVKKGAIVVGSVLATHGWISGSDTETFVSLAVAGVPLAISFWQDYGKAILLGQLEILKAKTLAQAAKLNAAGLPPVTVTQIADQSPTMTPDNVVKMIKTLPPAVQANVANAA